MRSKYVRSAKDVADLLGWSLTTVYVNRGRSLRKLDAGHHLADDDLPIGKKTSDGLRWADAELDRFSNATSTSKRRGGHRRRPRPLGATERTQR